MANVQKENGFTGIANEIFEQIIKIPKINATQLKIIMLIWRFTYGFQRKEHPISISFICEGTGVSKRMAYKALGELVDRRIIIQQTTVGKTSILAFNKNYDQWIWDEQNCTGEQSCTGERTCKGTHEQSCTPPVNNHAGEPVNNHASKKERKERLNKSERKETPPPVYINEFSRIYQKLENTFGLLSPMDDAVVRDFIDDGFKYDVFDEAIRRTLRRAKNPSFSYFKRIMTNWGINGIRTIPQVNERDPWIDEKAKEKQKENSKPWQGLSPMRSDEEIEADIQKTFEMEPWGGYS